MPPCIINIIKTKEILVMDAKVFCRKSDKGELVFYVSTRGETHYLFSQNYVRRVWDCFSCPMSIDRALNAHLAHGNKPVLHTMDKLLSYIRYVEHTYDLELLRRTQLKNTQRRRAAA